MSDDDIDLDRVVIDPQYRREVIRFLNDEFLDGVEFREDELVRTAVNAQPEPVG